MESDDDVDKEDVEDMEVSGEVVGMDGNVAMEELDFSSMVYIWNF